MAGGANTPPDGGTIEQIAIGGQKAILVALFLPGEGARGAEAGQPIYHRTYEPVGPG